MQHGHLLPVTMTTLTTRRATLSKQMRCSPHGCIIEKQLVTLDASFSSAYCSGPEERLSTPPFSSRDAKRGRDDDRRTLDDVTSVYRAASKSTA